MQTVSAGQRCEGDDFKKISSWVAILPAPTLGGVTCGMNFGELPVLHGAGDHPFRVLLMAVVCTSLYVVFEARLAVAGMGKPGARLSARGHTDGPRQAVGMS
ncbi:hypothetical protein ACIQV2_28665 [Streptomyces globosus]|uniref:hypothetical protein n=1 Tax=Streptomyces globosus TaxID=68209 RepID=UPI00380B4029